jgi:hypothetical protein
LRADLSTALALDAKQRDLVQAYLVRKFGDLVKITPQEVDER